MVRSRRWSLVGPLLAAVLPCLSCGGGSGVALGQIALGESHTTALQTPVGQVSARFQQDDAPAPASTCAAQLGPCKLVRAPSCAPACGADQTCQYDGACQPRCAQGCALSCPSGQACTFLSAGVPACAPLGTTLDAGTITLSGGSYPMSLDPPYVFSGPAGAPFSAGAALAVNVAGAADRGFGGFSAQLVATTYVQTALGQLSGPQVFDGTAAPLPITWTPGQDQVRVLVAGPGGSAACEADDGSGHLDLDRAVLQAVTGPAVTAATVSVIVVRERTQVQAGVPVQGLPAATGQVLLTTRSSEGAAFQCRTRCGGVCIDATFSNQNCGTCGNACQPTEVCSLGTCQQCTLADQGRCGACDYCLSTKPSCADAIGSCNQEPECVALRTCLGSCGTADCRRQCAAMHPTGTPLYNPVVACVCAPCQAACSASLICTVYPL